MERLSTSSRVEWPTTTGEPTAGADATCYSYEGTTGTCIPESTVPDAGEIAVRERHFGRKVPGTQIEYPYSAGQTVSGVAA